MKILIKNAKILNPDENIFESDVLIENEIISKIKKNIAEDVDRVIDASNKLLIPGFINTHCHLAMVYFRGVGENQKLEDWLFKSIFPMEAKLSEKHIEVGTKLALLECIKNGITTVCDAYFKENIIAKCFDEMGVRGVLSLGYHAFSLKTIQDIESEYLFLKNKYPNLNFTFYNHSTYTCDENNFLDIVKLAKKYKVPVSTHACETLKEVGDCVVKNNCTPIELLESYGYFDVPCFLAHCVHLDKKDIQILKKYDVKVCSNPASNAKLASGIAPIQALKNNDIIIALGTDGASSNNRLDMFREMYLASILQKIYLSDSTVIDSNNAFKMATINGAKALGLKNLGLIKEGYLADLVLLNLDDINTFLSSSSLSNVVYSMGTENVFMTMINGKILYMNNEFEFDKIDLLKNQAKILLEELK